jgi:hypothetical protein
MQLQNSRRRKERLQSVCSEDTVDDKHDNGGSNNHNNCSRDDHNNGNNHNAGDNYDNGETNYNNGKTDDNASKDDNGETNYNNGETDDDHSSADNDDETNTHAVHRQLLSVEWWRCIALHERSQGHHWQVRGRLLCVEERNTRHQLLVVDDVSRAKTLADKRTGVHNLRLRVPSVDESQRPHNLHDSQLHRSQFVGRPLPELAQSRGGATR